MKEKILIIITLFLLSSCGVYKVNMTIDGKEFEKKTFTISCGKISLETKQMHGGFLVDIALDVQDPIYLYGDSLITKLNGNLVGNSFRGRTDTLIGEREIGFFIWPTGTFWTMQKDTIAINFDGTFYCKDMMKVRVDKVLIIEP